MRWQFRAGQLVVILIIALLLRQLAVARLPVDFDEPVYFQAGQRYAAALRDGDLNRLINDDFHAEHPGLVKLVYATVFLTLPPAAEISADRPAEPDRDPAVAQQLAEMGFAARSVSMLFGVANVLLVALVNPLAGLFLAIHSYTVKYTAQVYLEALPMLTSTIAVFAYLRARGKANGWLWLSGAALGLTAAGKYIYCVAGVAIAIDMVWCGLSKQRIGRQVALLAGWGGLALLVFYVANPYLWPNPAGRLIESLFFHARYSQGIDVARAGYPLYQPFIWLFSSVPWHPQVIFVRLDLLISALGVIGLYPVWRDQKDETHPEGRVFVLWWLVGLLFLLLWPTKWPQYILTIAVPVSLCASAAVRWLWSLLPDEMKLPSERWTAG